MISEKEATRISKFLSRVLRHKPQIINIALDANGWANVEQLLTNSQKAGFIFDRETLDHVVATDNKTRYAYNETFDKIRANQGHSVKIDLGHQPTGPPEILYHGTALKSVESIQQTGLNKRKRQHVHLSTDLETAIKVGQRHGEPVVFEIAAQEMHKNNFIFYISDNGVWLTDNVPPRFLKLVS